jgi:hypothetical protein
MLWNAIHAKNRSFQITLLGTHVAQHHHAQLLDWRNFDKRSGISTGRPGSPPAEERVEDSDCFVCGNFPKAKNPYFQAQY